MQHTTYEAKVFRDNRFVHLATAENPLWTLCGLGTSSVRFSATTATKQPPPCPLCSQADPDEKGPSKPNYALVGWGSGRWHLEQGSLGVTMCGEDISLNLERRFSDELTQKARQCKTCFGRVPTAVIEQWFPQLFL